MLSASKEGADVDLIDQALIDQISVLSPVTVAELLSAPNLSQTLRRTILELPTLSMTEGVWNAPGYPEQKCSEPVVWPIRPIPSSLKAASIIMRHLSRAIGDFKTFVAVAGLRVAILYP